MGICSVEEAIADIRAGKMIILVDDEDRENEGDLVFAAEFSSPEYINFMATHARGLICLAMAPALVDALDLPLMTPRNGSKFGTNFTMSIEARTGVTTGISASDRSHTVLTAIADDVRPDDIVIPGHTFPLRAQVGGVLTRAGQTEGGVDLAMLAGLKQAAVICEIMRDDGEMARMPDLEIFAKKHNLKIATVRDIIKYRMGRGELSVKRVAASALPTRHGEFQLIAYETDLSTLSDEAHLALVMGDIGETSKDSPTLVRVHSECLTGDALGSLRCDCGGQLNAALGQIAKEGRGVLLYMRQEGRGIGLANKVKAYALQDQGLDTVQANEELGFLPDLRDYGVGAQMLVELGVKHIRLLTNNPRKIIGLEGYGLSVVEREALEMCPEHENHRYLLTKQEKLGHMLHVPTTKCTR